jgi:hypothetical protein
MRIKFPAMRIFNLKSIKDQRYVLKRMKAKDFLTHSYFVKNTRKMRKLLKIKK